MFGLTQSDEKRQQEAEMTRAERAFDAALMQPLAIQQEIARSALQECARTMETLSALSRPKDQEIVFRVRVLELDRKISAADAETMPPKAITAILAQTLLMVSAGARRGRGMERIGEQIARWSQNILPDFSRIQSRLAH